MTATDPTASSTSAGAPTTSGTGSPETAVCNCPICTAARAAAAAGQSLGTYLTQCNATFLNPLADIGGGTTNSSTSFASLDPAWLMPQADIATGEAPDKILNGTYVSTYPLSGTGSTGFDGSSTADTSGAAATTSIPGLP